MENLQMTRARRALRKRLVREKNVYRIIQGPIEINEGNPIQYNGKGDRFEFEASFLALDLEFPVKRYYEVTVYGPGRSYRIWEI